MTVYLLLGYYVGEGDEVIGVYSSKEKAEEVKLSNPLTIDSVEFDFFTIEEFEVK